MSERLPDAHQDARAQRQLAEAWREQGLLALAEGPSGLAAADQALSQALQRNQRLVALEPDMGDCNLPQREAFLAACTQHHRVLRGGATVTRPRRRGTSPRAARSSALPR